MLPTNVVNGTGVEAPEIVERCPAQFTAFRRCGFVQKQCFSKTKKTFIRQARWARPGSDGLYGLTALRLCGFSNQHEETHLFYTIPDTKICDPTLGAAGGPPTLRTIPWGEGGEDP